MSAIHRRVVRAVDVAISIQPLSRDASSGALTTNGSAFTATGRAGALTIERSRESERVDADDMSGADRDFGKSDFTITVEALKLAVGSAGDLEDIFENSPFVELLIQWDRAGVARPRYWYGLVERFSFNRAAVKNVDQLTISRIDIGQNNPATSSQL